MKKSIALLVVLIAGCSSPEVPWEPGQTHCITSMSKSEIREAMEWQHWKNPPMDALYDPLDRPGKGESSIEGKPGRIYCPKGMMLSWDLYTPGTPPQHADALWCGHCYAKVERLAEVDIINTPDWMVWQ